MAHGFISPFSLDSRLIAESRRVIEESRRLLAETEPMTRPPYTCPANSHPDASGPSVTNRDAEEPGEAYGSGADGKALVSFRRPDDTDRQGP